MRCAESKCKRAHLVKRFESLLHWQCFVERCAAPPACRCARLLLQKKVLPRAQNAKICLTVSVFVHFTHLRAIVGFPSPSRARRRGRVDCCSGGREGRHRFRRPSRHGRGRVGCCSGGRAPSLASKDCVFVFVVPKMWVPQNVGAQLCNHSVPYIQISQLSNL